MASRPPETSRPVSDTVARNRWLTMQAVRFTGFGLVILGILIARGVLGFDQGSGRTIGYALIVIGLADGFVIPQVLARKWRTPKP